MATRRLVIFSFWIAVYTSLESWVGKCQHPEINIDATENFVRFSDGTRRYYSAISFSDNNETFLVGGMDHIYMGSLISDSKANVKAFLKQSEKLPFNLDDDPLFLCQQDERRNMFCGSHVRLLIPVSSLQLTPRPSSSFDKFYSVSDDILVCATSAGHRGSGIYLINRKTLQNVRRLNMETPSAVSDDDPFATPHELYFTVRTLCPEFPEQRFAFVDFTAKHETTGNAKITWIEGLWLRKVGVQIKTFSNLEIIPYDKSLDGKQGALSAQLTSTLFPSPRSLLAGIGEFVGFHKVAFQYSNSTFMAFLRQEGQSRILRFNINDIASVPEMSDVPFEKTFANILTSLIVCESSSKLDCPRHGFCFTNGFQYRIIRDFAVINNTLFALFSTSSASWGARSALCVLSMTKVYEFFSRCGANNARAIDNIIDCDSASSSFMTNSTLHSRNIGRISQANLALNAFAIFEMEAKFSRILLEKHSRFHAYRMVIAMENGKLLKGHVTLDVRNIWTFNLASVINLSDRRERISTLALHPVLPRMVVLTDISVYMWQFDAVCSSYLRIRHCLKDLDCSWNFDQRLCVPKIKSTVASLGEEKTCLKLPIENVSINASQGSTVRLVCNPPCDFDAPVNWEIMDDVDKNKYLIMGDVLVLFDMFGSRSKPSSVGNNTDSEILNVACYAGATNGKPLVRFVIYKTCGAFCQRNRNMEAWCLKTWKQKIGLTNEATKYLRT